MTNSGMMKMELTRLDWCDVKLALLSIVIDKECELRDPETTEDRKKVLRGSIEKWKALRAEIQTQFDEQDKLDDDDVWTASKNF